MDSKLSPIRVKTDFYKWKNSMEIISRHESEHCHQQADATCLLLWYTEKDLSSLILGAFINICFNLLWTQFSGANATIQWSKCTTEKRYHHQERQRWAKRAHLWDSLVDKCTCHQVWWPEFNSGDPQNGRRELTSIHMPWHGCIHKDTETHTLNE